MCGRQLSEYLAHFYSCNVYDLATLCPLRDLPVRFCNLFQHSNCFGVE